MILKKVDPFSCAKVSGVLYAAIGLIAGFFFSLIAMMGAALGDSPAGALFGAGAVIILPVFYGGIGFVGGALMAWFYNVIAGWIGGVKVEFEQDSIPPQGPSVAG